ncbi:hypothetical protein MHYP_G00266180 [Metynnis hypsauchen]
MGSSESTSYTRMANATDMYLRIYYETSKMRLEELIIHKKGKIGFSNSSLSAEGKVSSKMIFKPDSRVHFTVLPPDEYTYTAREGELYVTIFLEKRKKRKKKPRYYCICENVYVPIHHSFVVTPSENIRLHNNNETWIPLRSQLTYYNL